MFWRFGFDNGSSIDSLLDKDEVSLEAILDEDDLLQECKSQNTRLIDYFQRVDVLKRLLGYVTGQIEAEGLGKFKYPYVATEVLCSEIWSIVETCLGHADQLLATFWETMLDRDPEDMKASTIAASHFAKIIAIFLIKKPVEMLAFIRSQPNVVERILCHIETPAIAELLLRIIQLDEQPGGAGVLEWLSQEQLMTRLIGRLSPSYSPDMHTVVSELIKSIISMSAPSTTGLAENSQIGPPSNCFARELARKSNVQLLVDYMLTNFDEDSVEVQTSGEPTTTRDDEDLFNTPVSSPTSLHASKFESCTSSVLHSICIVIDLIRQNNSDFFEPYLFHTLRNRLIQIQQNLALHDPEEGRITLQNAMNQMVERMGVVHLGPVLEILSEKLGQLQSYLLKPRSLKSSISTTVGTITPLTFERYRICELFAELLHCSNMALLNRSPEFDYLYDSEGRLQGGLSALEDLARVIAMGSGDSTRQDHDEGMDGVEPAMELPVHGTSHDNSSLLDSDEDMSDAEEPGSFYDEPMEDSAMIESANSKGVVTQSPEVTSSPTRSSSASSSATRSPHGTPSGTSSPPQSSDNDSENAGVAAVPRRRSSSTSIGSNGSTMGKRSVGSRRSSRRFTTQDPALSPATLPPGEHLKQKLLESNILSTVLDLFFDFPWNNFLHSVAYDLIHQILTGRVDAGMNRDLAIALFRDAKLMHRIVEGQKRNDVECAKPKGVRLGFMGHLTLISEDVLLALEHFPPDLQAVLAEYVPQPDWDEYIHGRYNETKQRDTSLLGGGKPILARVGMPGAWKVDEAEAVPASTSMDTSAREEGSLRGEFKRTTSARPSRESSADFGPMPENDQEEDKPGHPTFARYLAQEMHSPDEFGVGLGDSPDGSDEDDDGGWLTHSQFDLEREPPVTTRERRPLSNTGFDDSFSPGSLAVASSPFSDPFATEEDDDDAFGPFSDSSTNDPFSFPSSFSDGMQDSFGDFGEFQSADGEMTPTVGSWTFASTSSESDTGDGEGDVEGNGKAARISQSEPSLDA